MIEKFSLDFVRKIYNFLTTGNDDVNFYCMCVQNQNREAATNSPIKFALTLVKINVLCRLPCGKKRIFCESIGNTYLSEIFVRPLISELASGMLDNTHAVTDIFGSAFTLTKSKNEIFKIIEADCGVRGFAKLREKYDDDNICIKDIYKKINSQLCSTVDYKIELAQTAKYYVSNRYIIRMLDIAKCNGLDVTAIVKTCYPREFIETMLKKHDILCDRVYISSEGKLSVHSIVKDPKLTCVLSSNYNGFIKKFLKLGCKPFYYRNPKDLMQRIEHPALDDEFKDIYDTVCGLRLFSGLKRMSRTYELSYLCIAPSVFAFAQTVAQRVKDDEFVVCLCDEHSIFGQVIQKLCQSGNKPCFFPWSPLAGDKRKSVDKWKTIVEETPIFDYAYMGVFDSALRYSIKETKNNGNANMLAAIMATAWVDKSFDGVCNAVKQLVDGKPHIVIADPTAGKCGCREFCSALETASGKTLYTCLNISNFLDGNTNELKPLAKIIQGNKPLLYQIDGSNKKWLYQKKLNTSTLSEIYSAINDFTDDFLHYLITSKQSYQISGTDAYLLYKQALKQIENLF